MTKDSVYELFIPGIRLLLTLGCTDEEKAQKQPVDIDIKITFSKEPAGCRSDQLSDVCCYDTIVKKLAQSLERESFNLIEYLAARAFDIIGKMLQQEATIEITVAKPQHPVEHVQKAISFKYRNGSENKLPLRH